MGDQGPDPSPIVKLQVALGFLKNTGTDPLGAQLLLEEGPCRPM